jgi:hypothetical protein
MRPGAAGLRLVLWAVWTSVLVAGMLLSESVLAPAWVVVQVLLVVATAAPLPFWHRGDRFRGACLAGSGILFAAAVLGAVVYLIVYLPSAVLLLLAALADPQRRPRLTRVVVPVTLVAWLFVLLAGSAAGLQALYRAYLAPPNAYCVELQRFLPGDEFEALDRRIRNMPEVGPWIGQIGDSRRQIVVVDFREGITGADKARLGERLRALPEVGRVQRCRDY